MLSQEEQDLLFQIFEYGFELGRTVERDAPDLSDSEVKQRIRNRWETIMREDGIA